MSDTVIEPRGFIEEGFVVPRDIEAELQEVAKRRGMDYDKVMRLAKILLLMADAADRAGGILWVQPQGGSMIRAYGVFDDSERKL